MDRLKMNHAGYWILVLVLMTSLLTSCSDDDPAAPTDTNGAPAVPTIDSGAGAPANGATDVDPAVDLAWSCSDPDDDVLTYTVRFGTHTAPPIVAEDHASTSYSPAGLAGGTTYYWQIAASDGARSSTSPVWSFSTLAVAAETVSAPYTPTGPADGEVDDVLSYSTSGAVSSEGHTVEYRFDWNDGTQSAWSATTTADHSWSLPGTYQVTSHARCQDHPDIESASSAGFTVTVLGPETISTPDAPDGPATGETGANLQYSMTGAVSSHGHDVDIRFDWGNGVITAWTSADWGATHWNTAGTYEVKVQARCQTHTSIESEWSSATTVTITEPAETVSPPTSVGGPASTVVNDPVEFQTYNAASNVGHTLEYRFDWDDGTYSDWVLKAGVYAYGTHAWTDAGTYQVRSQARCQEHPDVVSDWSTEMSEIVIAAGETVPTPTWSGGLAGETTVNLGWWLPALTWAQSSVGHTLEWYVDFGDGTFRDWNANWSFSKNWTALGDYTVRARARCQDHPDLLSDWSADLIVHVVDLETIDGIPTFSGPSTATVGVPAFYTVTGVSSSHGHDLEYQLYDSYNDSVPGTPQGWTTMDNLSMTWDAPGTRVLQVQARCVDHPELESVKGYHFWVTITE